MGIQERKERDKEDLRRKIITAATELFREETYATVSMRKIAKRVEYSVGTLYLYYKDKDELFLAVQGAAFERAFSFIQELQTTGDPVEKLRNLGERYLRFGMENPDLYRLMFMMEHPMQAMEEGDAWHAGIELHNLLTSIVKECVSAGRIVSDDPDRLSFALWALVHGMVSLRISQRLNIYNGEHLKCPLSNIDTDQLVIDTNEMMIKILERHQG
jgi:AcrR family transcriptional regulator